MLGKKRQICRKVEERKMSGVRNTSLRQEIQTCGSDIFRAWKLYNLNWPQYVSFEKLRKIKNYACI